MNDRSARPTEITLSSACRIALMGVVFAMVLSLAMTPGADARPARPHTAASHASR
ncbi:MAG: hypothetical protein QM736_25250 [Vicinamibacterales bacterium]